MAGYQCPFCQQIMTVTDDNQTVYNLSFTESGFYTSNAHIYNCPTQITYYKCPNCNQISILLHGLNNLKGLLINVHPPSSCKQYPDYIPQQIRNDYEEACSILNTSPKASATLSRRCLQGMIRDFWGIKEKTLYQEITQLKGKVYPDQWKAIDALRKLGNIGAHMEQDVNVIIDIDPDEAFKLIQLIEFLMKAWYINREEEKQLYSDITDIAIDKQLQQAASE